MAFDIDEYLAGGSSKQPKETKESKEPEVKQSGFDIDAYLAGAATPVDNESSAVGAFGRGVLRGALPAAAGIVSGAAGAVAGAPAGPIGSIAGGLGLGFAGSAAAAAAQEKFLAEHPEVAKALGLDVEMTKKDLAHPYASMAGEIAPNLLAFRPSGAMFRSAKGLEKAAAERVAAERAAAIANATLNTGVGAGVQVGQELMGEEPVDWTKVGIAALGGALGQKETSLGRGLTRIGEIPAGAATKAAVNALRRPGEVIPEVQPEIAPKAPETTPAAEVVPKSASQDTQAMLNMIPKPGEAVGIPIKPIETPKVPKAEIAPMPEGTSIRPSDKDATNIPKFEPITEPVNTLTAKEEPPVAKVKTEPMKPIDLAERIKDPFVQDSLKRYADEAGWAQKGGSILREVADDYSSPVIGRTTWIPNKLWWSDRPVSLKGDMNGAATRNAINKAFNGEKLTADERRMMEFLVKLHDNDMVEGDTIRAEMEARDKEIAEFNKQFETQETPEQAAARTAEEQARIKAQEDAEIQAEMDRKAAEYKAEVARRSQEQAGNFELGQTPEESLTGQRRLAAQDEDIPFDFQKETVQATPEQVEKAQSVIKRLPGADMAWQEGDLGLIKGYGEKTGNVIYTPYKNGTGWQYAVEKLSEADFKKMGFTPAERQRLLDVRERLEKQAEDLHAKKPFLKFEKDVQFSPDIPPNLQKVAESWTKLLGIKQKIYFTTLEHAAANKEAFTGPHRKIGSASASPSEGGFTTVLADGNRVIAFKKSSSVIKTLETIAHELGHTHMYEVFANAPKDVQDALKAEHLKWANSIKGTTPAKDVIQGLRARKSGKTTAVPEGLEAKNLKDVDTYWRSFKEWYADQTAKWATTNEKPLNVVEKFFSKLGKSLKAFYSKLKNSGYLPNETFKNYIESQTAKLDLEPVAEKQARPINPDEQMRLFEMQTAEEPATRLPEKMSWGIGGLHPTTPIKKPSLWHETSGYNAADLIGEDLHGNRARTTHNFFLTDNKDIAIGQHGNNGVMLEYDGYNVSGKEHKKPMTGDLAGREYVADAIAKDAIKSIHIEKGVKLPLKALVLRDLKARFDMVKNADGSTTFTRKTEEPIQFAKATAEAAPEKVPASAKNVLSGVNKKNINWWKKTFPEVDIENMPKTTESNWDVKPNTWIQENIIRKFQDKHIDLKRTVAAIKNHYGEIAERWNPYQKDGLWKSKAANEFRQFDEKDLDPLAKKIDKLNLTTKEVTEYLHNKHAERRNNQMNKINPDVVDPDGTVHEYALKDRGSGISTDDARNYLKNLPADKKAALEDVAQDVYKIIKETQNILVKTGQKKQDEIDAWHRTYGDEYVPLQRDVEEEFMSGFGGGRSMASKNIFEKRAMGSEREVLDILNSVVRQREVALENAAKMEVNHALFGMFLKYPNPQLALPVSPKAIKNPELLARELDAMGLDGRDIVGMMQERQTRSLSKDPNTGLDRVVYKTNPLERYKDHVLPVRIDGEDSYIFFNAKDPVSANMVKAFRGMDTPTVGLAGQQIGKATQWMAKVNTQWNPVFGGINFLRDFSAAMANLSSTPLKGMQSTVAGGIKPAFGTVWKVMRAERAGKPMTPEQIAKLPEDDWTRLYYEFRAHGGQTLYREQLSRRAHEQNVIDDKIKGLHDNAAKKTAKQLFGAFSDFNDAIENAIRLSAFKAAKIDKNLSLEQAATLAKELTVNFDRQGAYSKAVNNYFAFFNAASQGINRMAQTLKGPAGKKIIMGGVGLGALQAGMMALAGFKDNDPPEFVKSRNFIIPTPDGKYLAIPYPLGLHFLPNMGRLAVEAGLHGDFSGHAGKMIAVMADAFNPLGGGELSLQTISPTVLDPAVAIATNRDPFGRPISKEDRATSPSTGFSRSREQSTEMNKQVARAINYITGGTEDTKGFLSPTADQLDFLVGQVTGGVGREAMKIGKTVGAIATGDTENLAAYNIPLAGRFYGDIKSPAANTQHFYDNVTKMAEYEATIKGMRERKENVAQFLNENPEARLWQQTNNAENQISAINKQQKEMRKRGVDEARIKALDERKQQIMTRINERVNSFRE